MRDFAITLRIDCEDAKKADLMLRAAKVAAKHLLTTAILLSGDSPRKPQVALETCDLFMGPEEISLIEEDEC